MGGIGSTWEMRTRGRVGALAESGWKLSPEKVSRCLSVQEYVHGADIQVPVASWKRGHLRMDVGSPMLTSDGAALLVRSVSAATAAVTVDVDEDVATMTGIAAAVAAGFAAGEEGAAALRWQTFLGLRSCLFPFPIPILLLLRALLLTRLTRQKQTLMTLRMLP